LIKKEGIIMKKIITLLIALTVLITLSACTQAEVTCGEGTIIQDGTCVSPEVEEDENEEPTDVTCGEGTSLVDGLCVADDTPITCDEGSTLVGDECVLDEEPLVCDEGYHEEDGACVLDEEPALTCDSVVGEVFYEADFTALSSTLVDNEPGREHTANNFVVWGQSEATTLLEQTSVVDGSLVIQGLIGTQFEQYYDSGLGYQYFNFENDVNYTVCTIVEGATGQSMTSELGIYYGYGTKDEFSLTGEPQLIVQDFRPTLTTNTDRGQYVLFTGNISGELTVHYIKIVKNN